MSCSQTRGFEVRLSRAPGGGLKMAHAELKEFPVTGCQLIRVNCISVYPARKSYSAIDMRIVAAARAVTSERTMGDALPLIVSALAQGERDDPSR